MLKLCPKCNYLGESKYDLSRKDLYHGIVAITVGSLCLIVGGDILGSRGIFIVLMSFVILFGISEIFGYFRGSKTCPKCGNKEMLPIDDPEALNLIKKYDLTVGENAPQITQNEPNPNPFETHKP